MCLVEVGPFRLSSYHSAMPQHFELRRGVTLLELLTVLAVVSLLTSLVVPAVHAGRESARRSSCVSNLRNQILAVQAACNIAGEFPAGRKVLKDVEYSWCVDVLPHLELAALHKRFDRSRSWKDPENLPVADAAPSVFACPSSLLGVGPGRTDYAGISGTLMRGVWKRGSGLFNGILVENSPRRPLRIMPADVTDGASHTIALAECGDRPLESGGRWASGLNIISHDNGSIATTPGGEIFSSHADGAAVAFLDGHVQVAAFGIPAELLGAMCTRNGEESLGIALSLTSQ
jgi:prepilin-type N-terminal cleavage/methylation domain-containing protein/prepilin-type processing-associated H-X9-DG protein